MKRSISIIVLLLLLVTVVPVQFVANAKTVPQILVNSQYTLNRYGYAVVNETVRFYNNGTVPVPTLNQMTLGFGNLSSNIVAYNLTGSGFTLSPTSPSTGPFTIMGVQTVPAGSTVSFTLRLLLNGVVSVAKNGSLSVLVLTRPALDTNVTSLRNAILMPQSTEFKTAPAGLTQTSSGVVVNYSATHSNVAPAAAGVVLAPVKSATTADFHPLTVYRASRTISVDTTGKPIVTDSLTFKNLGTTVLTSLIVSPLTTSNGAVTVVPVSEPRLLNPAIVTLSAYSIDLTNGALGIPVAAGTNYTISYRYPLRSSYYTVNGGVVTMSLPTSPPIGAFVRSYSILISVPSGVRVVQGPPQTMANASPWQGGTTKLAYGLSVGWAVDAGIPAASAIFVLLLIGLFVSRTTTTEEEESEEESSTELATDMIKAFEEKTSLINGLWPEIASADPNELDKEYFDELRGRLDAFRSKALQRLNEVKQKSTSQKFFELLSQIQTTEREVERAAKDKLNLYEQYYTRRMRREVYDRLLPQYNKRLEKALNQLSDELHVVQREAKLL